MNKLTQTIWVIRAGKKSEAHQLFIENGLIVLARQDMGNLRLSQKERSAFYAAYASHHHADGKVAIRGIGGKFFRFIHEVCVGNLILYPCRLDKRIYFGKWPEGISMTILTEKNIHIAEKCVGRGLLQKVLCHVWRRELGAARTFFLFTDNVEEIKKLIAKSRFPKASSAKGKIGLQSNIA